MKQYVGILEVPALDGAFDLDRVIQFDEARRCWSGTGVPWRVELEKTFGCEINDVYGGGFYADNATGYLYFYGDYVWDGASGTTLDNPALRLASAIHDAICTRGPKGRRVVPGYWKRHEIYRRVMLAHCPYPIRPVTRWKPWQWLRRLPQAYHFLRSWTHWTGLVAFNWAWDIIPRSSK